MKKRIRWRMVKTLCIILTVLSAVALVFLFSASKSEKNAATVFEVPKETKTSDDEAFTIDWEYWQEINPDIVAWVIILGTHIDYPVMQASADDPTYYLYHDIYRNRNSYGVPYIDVGCSTESLNVIISAHHMAFDEISMFSELQHYLDAGFMEEHKEIHFFTPEETQVLDVRAAEIEAGYNQTKVTGFNDTEQLLHWYEWHYQNALTKRENPEDEETSQVFAFVTCHYPFTQNQRTIVFAVDS